MLLRLLLAICLRALCAAARDASSLEEPKVKAGRTLFGSGVDPLSWDADELRQIRKLHSRSFEDKGHFLSSPDVASYLGLSAVDALHLPIPVNVVFVGFGGEGNLKVKISPAELQSWFEHLDHIIPHTRVLLSELSCREDGHCSGLDDTRRPMPLPSYVHFNISCHAIKTSHEVLSKFERAIKLFSRPMQRRLPRGPQQVDAVSMEMVIDGFLTDLGLDKGYTVLVLNPPWPNSGSVYRYRAGLSKEEIDLLTADRELLHELETTVGELQSSTPVKTGPAGFLQGWLSHYRPKGKFEVNNLEYESSMWARHAEDWLTAEESRWQQMAEKLTVHRSMLVPLLLLKGFHGEADLSVMLQTLQQNEPHRSNQTAFGKLRVMEPEEGCLLDAWVGHARWVFLDLSALPADWGPWVGGDGMKAAKTLPSVIDHFGRVMFGGEGSATDTRDSATEEELRLQLSSEKDAVQAVIALDYRSPADVGKVKDYKFDALENVPDEVLMQAELDVYENFALKHCNNIVNPPKICGDLKDRIDKLILELHSLGSMQGETMDFDRDHAWDIFGLDEELEEADATPEARAKDMFLAHMAATVSRAIQHVFAPPTLAWPHHGLKDDTTAPYAKYVTFDIYIIADPTRRTESAGNSWQDFSIRDLRNELTGLKLIRQEFQFAVHRLRLTDDPTLASALSAAMRSTNVKLGSRDIGAKAERIFFDSMELKRVLSRKYKGPPQQESGSDHQQRTNVNRHNRLEVPIFIISLDRDQPIFIDKHYVAKALDDMVIVVHNGQYRGQHPMGFVCNGVVVGQMLAAPLKAAVAAVMQHLGGLLPPHLGYSPSHSAVTHDWLWSVGSHPFSLTSPGWKATQAQKDALHRSYILDSLDFSIEMVNKGIALLSEEHTHEEMVSRIPKMKGVMGGLLREFSKLVDLWRRIVSQVGMLDFENAVLYIESVESTAERFLELAAQLKAGLHQTNCQPKQRLALGIPDEVLGIALLVGAAVGVYRLLPRVKKSKFY